MGDKANAEDRQNASRSNNSHAPERSRTALTWRFKRRLEWYDGSDRQRRYVHRLFGSMLDRRHRLSDLDDFSRRRTF